MITEKRLAIVLAANALSANPVVGVWIFDRDPLSFAAPTYRIFRHDDGSWEGHKENYNSSGSNHVDLPAEFLQMFILRIGAS